MKEESGQTLARQWAILRGIPRSPLRVTTAELEAKLADEGFAVSRRTLERDLHGLSGLFPLELDDRARPYGWSWAKGANFEFMPRLTSSQAVALLLASAHLQNLLPRAMHKELAPAFDAAERALAASGWKDWHKRTAVVPTSMALIPPKVDARVMAAVESAMAHGRRLEGRYRAKGGREAKEMKINPLGLICRGPVLYLVCTLFEYDDVRQLTLHRLSDAKEAAESRRDPKGFVFSEYAREVGSTLLSRGTTRLVARFDAAAAEHLRESPLSQDQTWQLDAGGETVTVTATVQDDEQLRWWLLAFGGYVEVLDPKQLRREIAASLAAGVTLYQGKKATAIQGDNL